jgi:peptidoglycan/xylan/chitin deacetylase (PgdA/CDA1 family)
VIILNFHGVGMPPREIDPGEKSVWLTCERFERVLDRLSGRDDVKVTFDDGNQSDRVQAVPRLLKRGLRADFFIVAARIGRPGYLNRDDLNELTAAGMDIGTHGSVHRAWRGLTTRELHEEVFDARDAIERVIERPVRLAACPFGAYDRASLRALRKAQFAHVLTSDRQPALPNEWLQPRYTMHADDTDLELEAILSGSRSRPRWLHDLRCTLKQLPMIAR